MEILALINFYFSVALFVLIVNAIIGGYQGKQIGVDDVIQSAFWPVSLSTLIGMVVRIGVESYKEAAKPNKVQEKKETK